MGQVEGTGVTRESAGFDPLLLHVFDLERIAGGLRWAEGPVWFGDHRVVLWSDIPNDRILRWEEDGGTVSCLRRPAGHANGLARDRQGRLVACEHGGRRMTRTEPDGSITTLVDRFEGRRLNSPNDCVVVGEGLWFTDPTYGIASHYEGGVAEPELGMHVYRHDLATGETRAMLRDRDGPNGLGFSPDGRIFYLVETDARPNRISAFPVGPDGLSLGEGSVLVEACDGGLFDGIAIDALGNIWAAWGRGRNDAAPADGVAVFAPDGTPLGRIVLPERAANLCFGGRHRNRLFVAASTSLYSVHVRVQGAAPL